MSEISLRGLVKSFQGPHGRIEAVRGVDFDISTGETVALLGPNGAGKSTTIDMLLGLLEPNAGSVSVFGRSPSQAVAAGEVGGMLQTGSLIRDLSARELVAMIASLYPAPMDVEGRGPPMWVSEGKPGRRRPGSSSPPGRPFSAPWRCAHTAATPAGSSH